MRRRWQRQFSATLPSTRRRPWVGALGSTLLHLLVIAAVTGLLSRPRHDPAAPTEMQLADPTREVQLVYLPPPAKPEPLPPITPRTPGPDQTPGAPPHPSEAAPTAPNNQPEVARSEPRPGTETATADAAPVSAATTASATPLPTPTTTAAPASALESEAQRIFGRPSTPDAPIAGSRENRPWDAANSSSLGCKDPDEPRDSALPAMGYVTGRIIRLDTGQPLKGARLQILGTPYGTFTNDQGEYRLEFDRSLVTRCRTQAVRITAQGYETRDVTLFLGYTPKSDVYLRRF